MSGPPQPAPQPNTPPVIHCGICAARMNRRHYTHQLPFGVATRSVMLCDRCDLSPDPPVRRSP